MQPSSGCGRRVCFGLLGEERERASPPSPSRLAAPGAVGLLATKTIVKKRRAVFPAVVTGRRLCVRRSLICSERSQLWFRKPCNLPDPKIPFAAELIGFLCLDCLGLLSTACQWRRLYECLLLLSYDRNSAGFRLYLAVGLVWLRIGFNCRV